LGVKGVESEEISHDGGSLDEDEVELELEDGLSLVIDIE